MGTNEKLVAAIEEFISGERDRLDYRLSKCESPIEQLMMLAFHNHGWSAHGDINEHFDGLTVARRFPGVDANRTTVLQRDDSGHMLFMQLPIVARGVKARLDFAALATDDYPAIQKMAIELDGHDFHERTKEQARRDKARDRAMTLAGWTVLRFTGSDVYARADEIAEDIFWELAGDPVGRGQR